MDRNPLKIISKDSQVNLEKNKINRRVESQAKYDRQWLKNPTKFITKNAVEKNLRRKRILELIQKHLSLNEKQVVDLGCGYGYLSRELRDLGAYVDAVDISQNALKEFEKFNLTNIKLVHDFLPKSFLSDDHYDLVIASDLIASLNESEYRLLFSELARIVKKDGFVIVSTSIDLNSEDALQKFASLASTELEFIEWAFSYHFLYIKLVDFLLFPQRVVRAANDKEYRNKSIKKRIYLKKLWFQWSSTKVGSYFWKLINLFSEPMAANLLKSEKTLIVLEKLSKSLFKERAISHAILLGKRKSLFDNSLNKDLTELKHKKQVWE